jgi:GNAT superfamily N-acetyltransferase
MIQYVKKTKLWRFIKTIKIDLIYSFFVERIFINKVAVTVEKDLSMAPPLTTTPFPNDIHAINITSDLFTTASKRPEGLRYSTVKGPDDRRLKALGYLKKGYRGIALAIGNEVCGDIWYVGPRADKKGVKHPDMKWLGLRCNPSDTYAFDMYLHPEKRGNNLATLLQNEALRSMKKDGFTRAFGYYWATNTPALWVHRMLEWKNLRRVKVSRFLFVHFHY